jgi:hypothetical protein
MSKQIKDVKFVDRPTKNSMKLKEFLLSCGEYYVNYTPISENNKK